MQGERAITANSNLHGERATNQDRNTAHERATSADSAIQTERATHPVLANGNSSWLSLAATGGSLWSLR